MAIATAERQGTVIPGAVTDADGRLVVVGAGGLPVGADLPVGATQTGDTSGNKANLQGQAILPAVAGRTNYLEGFDVTAGGATAASVVDVTVSGIVGGTRHYSFTFPVLGTPAIPLAIEFPRPIPATGPNTAITVTLPAGGAGNTNAAVNSYGFLV